VYTSELTKDTPTYRRDCGKGSYHYQTIEVNVEESGNYGFDSNSSTIIYGYIYKSSFDPFNPNENLIAQSNFICNEFHFYLATHLDVNITYILVVTTLESNSQGEFSVLVTGPNTVNFNRTGNYSSFLCLNNTLAKNT
jgi:hypothetical protein